MELIRNFLEQQMFPSRFNLDFRVLDGVYLGLIVLLAFVLYYILRQHIVPNLFARIPGANNKTNRKLLRWVKYSIILIIVNLLLVALDQNHALHPHREIYFSSIAQVLIIIQLARILDWVINKAYIEKFFMRRDEKPETTTARSPLVEKENASRTVQWVVYILATLVLLGQIGYNPALRIPKTTEADNNLWVFHLSDVLSVVLVLLIARLVVWVVTQILLYRYYRKRSINLGDQYALNKLLKYVIYVLAFVIAFNYIGVKTTLLLGGAAALLVGVGLGLQQTFNDFFSGILLLTERRVEIGDTVQVGDFMGRVMRIGIRTSQIENINEVIVIVPNSKLVNENVINYSQEEHRARFHISVGVEYGSDLELVSNLLLRAASNVEGIYAYPSPSVQFLEFGDSALQFRLFFYVHDFLKMEVIRSKVRFEVDRLFREHGVNIPFPQRTIHVRGPEGQTETFNTKVDNE